MRTLIFPVMAFGLTIGCATSHPPAAETREIVLNFDARIGDQSLECGVAYPGVGSTKASVTLQDFRIYASNFRLISNDGKETPLLLTPDGVFQSDRVALLDFENATGNCNGNAATNKVVRGRAPVGDYVGLAFDIGVPADLNHEDPTLAAAPLNFSALTWAWRYGYKFTTIDLETGRSPAATPSGHAASGFSIHLGSVDCGAGSPTTRPEQPCATPNRPSYRLDAFDPARQVVVLDLGALLAETDVTVNDPDSASGCMSSGGDDDCIAIMDGFGLSFRGRSSRGQRFVRAAAPN